MISLSNWCWRTKKLISSFDHIDINHIYREINHEVDTLSKEASIGDEGFLYWEEYIENKLESRASLNYFWM